MVLAQGLIFKEFRQPFELEPSHYRTGIYTPYGVLRIVVSRESFTEQST